MDDRTAVLGTLSEEIFTHMLGIETEERFIKAIEEGPMPEYVRGVRQATFFEDRVLCVDMYIMTDYGEAPFQIKRSYNTRGAYDKYFRKGIIIQVIPPSVSDRIIRQDAIRQLESWRANRRRRISKWRPQWASIASWHPSHPV